MLKHRLVFGVLMVAALSLIITLDVYMQNNAAGMPLPAWLQRMLSGGLVFTLLAVAAAPKAISELCRLARANNCTPLCGVAITGALVLLLEPLLLHTFADSCMPIHLLARADGYALLVAALLAAAFVGHAARYGTDNAMPSIASTVLVACYIGIAVGMLLRIRVLWGMPVLVLMLIAVKLTDIGAYFVGSYLGRHKLIPWLSPGKTVEGLVGGVLVGTIVCCGFSLASGWTIIEDSARWPGWQTAVFAACMGLAGQAGDLAISLLKRGAAAKDSGQVVPGFGGIMDILDSPLGAAAAAYVLLALLHG